jgi:two-component system, sensor histidine kinase PdtaS
LIVPFHDLLSRTVLFTSLAWLTHVQGFAAPSPGEKRSFEHYYEQALQRIDHRDYITAEAYLDTALTIALSESDETHTALVELRRGITKKYLRDFGPALEHFLRALQTFERGSDWANLTLCHLELSEFYRATGQYDNANQHINTAFEIYSRTELNDTVLLTRLYNRLAAIDNESDTDPHVSIAESHKALSLARSIPDPNLMATSMNELGFSYKNLQVNDSSDWYYREAERLWFENGHYYDAIHAMNNRATMYRHNLYRDEEIIPLLEKIVDIIAEHDLDYPLTEIYHNLYTHYLINLADSGKAFIYLDKYHYEEINRLWQLHDVNLYNVSQKYENEKIKSQYDRVSQELDESSKNLQSKTREQLYLVLLIIAMAVAMVLIVLLVYKLRKSNAELRRKNIEKDSLVQEIHHRVKNNLQFISSLMSMQKKASASAEDTQTLIEASRRINAMALVHEMLYNQSEQKGISIKLYLNELVDSLNDLVNTDQRKITFDMNITEADFAVSQAIALGMITSEIISNSIKHAFQSTENPQVSVTLTEPEPGRFFYTIGDNGSGLKDDYDRGKTLGMRLVDIFSRQLKGDYAITGKNGFEFSLAFNKL